MRGDVSRRRRLLALGGSALIERLELLVWGPHLPSLPPSTRRSGDISKVPLAPPTTALSKCRHTLPWHFSLHRNGGSAPCPALPWLLVFIPERTLSCLPLERSLHRMNPSLCLAPVHSSWPFWSWRNLSRAPCPWQARLSFLTATHRLRSAAPMLSPTFQLGGVHPEKTSVGHVRGATDSLAPTSERCSVCKKKKGGAEGGKAPRHELPVPEQPHSFQQTIRN